VPPPGYLAPAGHGGGGVNCAAPPAPFTAVLDFPSKYEGSGKARDQVNEAAEAEYKEKIRPINEMEKGVNKLVDQYLKGGQEAALQCALMWMTRWAQADALDNDAANHTGKSMRKWALGSIASAYLRLKFCGSHPLAAFPKESQQIEAWLGRIADRVMPEWQQTDPKLNNHYYWAAWAEMATAVALNRRDLFDWSVSMYRVFEKQLDADGYLPNELARDSRALGYHAYALTPLSMIAAFAKANGVDLPKEGNGALARLAERVLQGAQNPGTFAAKTGTEQNLEGVAEDKWPWLEPYCWSVGCSGAAAAKLNAIRPANSYRLGGDLTAAFAAGSAR
jgi:poly(beta-D-mannuronate) lyase